MSEPIYDTGSNEGGESVEVEYVDLTDLYVLTASDSVKKIRVVMSLDEMESLAHSILWHIEDLTRRKEE